MSKVIRITRKLRARVAAERILNHLFLLPDENHPETDRKLLLLGAFDILTWSPRTGITIVDVWKRGEGKKLSLRWPTFEVVSLRPGIWLDELLSLLCPSRLTAPSNRETAHVPAVFDRLACGLKLRDHEGVLDGGHRTHVLAKIPSEAREDSELGVLHVDE